MPADRDDDLGAHLDAYLTALEAGDEPPSSVASAETESLELLVRELHNLAQVLDHPTASMTNQPEIPRTVGKYRIRQFLGEGGQSRTYLAEDPDLERIVVIKRYHEANSATQREGLLNEARALARISSPFVACCYDAGQDEQGVPFLVLEHVPGCSLAQLPGGQPLARILSIVEDVAQGLQDVHTSGLVHRDVKPANIVIGDDGQARLVDFGMAHALQTPAEKASGTPAYMAPEQARGEADRIDARTDVFGLGAVFYELLGGSAPFARGNRELSLAAARRGLVARPRSKGRPLPLGLVQLCMRCLSADKLDRYATVDEFLRGLTRWKRIRLLRRAMAAAALAALLLATASFGIEAFSDPEPKRKAETFRVEAAERHMPVPARFLESIPADVKRIFAVDGELRQDFAFEVDIPGARVSRAGVVRLRAGDRVAFRVQADRDCFVTVLSLGPGPPTQIFPRPPYDQPEDARILANQPTTIPKWSATGYVPIRAVKSAGKEAICIVASAQPISLGGYDGRSQLVFRSPAQQSQLRTAIRGLVRQPESEAHAVSQLVIPLWVAEDDRPVTMSP